MNWLNIHTDTLRGEEYLGADPVERATWLSLLGWCATQENGGIIPGASNWKDRKWQQVCGVTKHEVELESELYEFTGDDLLVHHYPIEAETAVIAKREAGKKGGRPRKEIPNKPSGLAQLNHKVKDTSNSVITKGKERKGKDKGKKTGASIKLPFTSNEFAQTWESWVSYLKAKRKTPTQATIKKQLNLLSKHNEQEAIETIDLSITNGWQGLFPRDKGNSKQLRCNDSSSPGNSKEAGEGINIQML